MAEKSTEEKLFTVKTNPDTESHLKIDEETCRKCETKVCLYVCPANVYQENEQSKTIVVNYENCLECGTCKIACDKIDWKYPRAKYGVSYKQG